MLREHLIIESNEKVALQDRHLFEMDARFSHDVRSAGGRIFKSILYNYFKGFHKYFYKKTSDK